MLAVYSLENASAWVHCGFNITLSYSHSMSRCSRLTWNPQNSRAAVVKWAKYMQYYSNMTSCGFVVTFIWYTIWICCEEVNMFAMMNDDTYPIDGERVV